MPNKRYKTNKIKNQKRVIDWMVLPVSHVFDYTKTLYNIHVIYIIDRGNLINDVRKKYDELISVTDKPLDTYTNKYAKSRQKIKHDLESQIRATGANEMNAEICAKKLMQER